MSIWNAVIGAGANLLGGWLGRESVEDQQARNEANQREFAQHGVQWRVADAKAAGVHPVYALGGSGASYSPQPVIVDPMAEAIRNMGASMIPRGYGLATSARGVDGMTEGYERAEAAVSPVDAYAFERQQIPSSAGGDDARTAGPAQPAFTTYTLGGLPFDAPSKNLSEPLESMGEGFIAGAMTIQRNIDRYGEEWAYQFGQKLFGVKQIMGYGEAFWDRLMEISSKIADAGVSAEGAAKSAHGATQGFATGMIEALGDHLEKAAFGRWARRARIPQSDIDYIKKNWSEAMRVAPANRPWRKSRMLLPQ